jgi:5'-nucleotidase
MFVLLVNDDGVFAPGLRALYAALAGAGHTVRAVAPLAEQSGASSSVTLALPLRAREVADGAFTATGVSGSPADCVKLALSSLIPARPDVVVAGINAGGNTGVDVIYSGTVAAALEGALAGIPAMAVSYDAFRPGDLGGHARHAVELLERIDWTRLPERRVLNLNYPDRPLDRTLGVRVCSPAAASWEDRYEQRRDPRGYPYWWLSGCVPCGAVAPDSDRALLGQGFITLSPLRFDYADPAAEQSLRAML